jgi:hypothetical protein
MRAVIVGLDFVYDSVGNLKPIEMNTNIGYSKTKIEDDNVVFDMIPFENFVTANGFEKITYIGINQQIKEQITNICTNLSLQFEFVAVGPTSITIPFVEDTQTHLIVRTAFDTTAILDSTYCKNKVEYLNLIKDAEFGSEFAYLNEENILINNITNIQDNGIHPNFILKAVKPVYDKLVYPKFYKVANQTELDIVLQNVTKDYFLMPYYFNESKVHLGKVTKLRKISMIFPPNLNSIHIGAYTDLASLNLNDSITYSSDTFEINNSFREAYYTKDFTTGAQPKLLDDDYVIMSDGSPKSGYDLQVGDIIKTIDVPNAQNVNVADELVNYHIDMDTFLNGVTYSTNKVIYKERINGTVEKVVIEFTDATNWFDTINSNYLVYENNEIKFKKISDFVAGDVVLLINTTDTDTIQIVNKIVQSVNVIESTFTGWNITVQRAHLFLTSAGNPLNSAVPYFVSIEHNSGEGEDCIGDPWGGQGTCTKGFCCNSGTCNACA